MAGAAVAILLLLGVAIYSLSRLSTSPWASHLSPPNLQLSSRQELPHFEYADGEKSLSAQNFEGHWTLLTFWSIACTPCLAEMPALNQLAQGWQGPQFEVVTVNIDEGDNLEQAKRYLSETEIVLPTFFDKQGTLKSAFGVHEYPRHFLIGPDTKIAWSATGAFAWNENSARDRLLKLMERLKMDQEKSQDQPE